MANRRWPLHKNKQEVFNSETVLCLKSTEEERKWKWEPRETGTKEGKKKTTKKMKLDSMSVIPKKRREIQEEIKNRDTDEKEK